MTWLRVLALRFSGMFAKRRRDAQLEEELQSHFEMLVEQNIERGMPAEEARRAAKLALGGAEQIKEAVRDQRGLPLVESLIADIRFGLRMLRKNPSLTAVAILTLALGIGASTVAFSAFYNLLFNAFAARDASRLIVFSVQNSEVGVLPELNLSPLGGPLSDIDAIRNQSQVFEDIVGYHRGINLLQGGNRIYQVYNTHVTPNAFEFYGVPALLGRGIVPADGMVTAPPVFVMSYKTWKGEFRSDPGILGRSFLVDDNPRTLVGIMPPRFQAYGALVQIWTPITTTASPAGTNPEAYVDTMMARLKPGVTLETASADLDVIVKRLAQNRPNDFPKHFTTRALSATDFLMGPFGIGSAGGPETQHFDIKHMLYALLAGAMILLLIACSNVASLLLARATVRGKEIAVRTALGATRGRLIQQLIVESSLLAAGACMLGCIFAFVGMKGVTALIPDKGASIGGEAVISLDWRILVFALIITTLATVFCGLAPAFHMLRRDLQPSLAGSRRANVSFRGWNLRSGIVIGEVALSILLLTGAGLMVRSFFLLTHIDLGFNADRLLFVAFRDSHSGKYPPGQEAVIFQTIVEHLKSLPGVADVAINNSLPGYNAGGRHDVTVPGSSHVESVGLDGCSVNALQVLELQLVRGRWLTDGDVTTARQVAVINQTMALHFFGDTDPVGRQFTAKGLTIKGQPPKDTEFQVIGVLRDVKDFGPQVPVVPMAFIPRTAANSILGGGLLFIKTKVAPASLMPVVQEQIWAFDHNVIFSPQSGPYLDTFYWLTYSAYEFGLMTFAPLAGIALLLVMSGIFSVMAYTVSLQTREIGIRMALGAQQGDVSRMVLRKGLGLVTAGIAIGLCASFALTRFLASQIWGVSPTDPWTFGAVIALIVAVGLAACYIPARRATRVHPMVALRYE